MSNTAYRGFGAPQSQFVLECAVDAVARARGVRPELVRERNLHERAAVAPWGQPFTSPVRDMWQHAKRAVGWDERVREAEAFNGGVHGRAQRLGVALVPTTYGIAFPVSYLNASNAYVSVVFGVCRRQCRHQPSKHRFASTWTGPCW